MKTFSVATHKKDEVIDITDTIEAFVSEKQMQNGICIIYASHTTCAITIMDLDAGTDLDLLDTLRAIMPKLHFRHPHNPAHVPDHILSAIIGPSVSIPMKNGQLVLGMWQRVVLVEFDGPRHREVTVSLLEEHS